ncbi:MAG: hypothetical protein ACRDNY_03870 [Gaiellaceae bacterium]
MKRYLCTVAAGLLVALVGAGPATATIDLPVVGDTQEATQSTEFGDQTVGEQRNEADVIQEQGNGNVNVSPAIAIFGDAETKNAQGNGNTADASVTQSNEANESQTATQWQDLDQEGGDCCRPTYDCKASYDCKREKKDECCSGQSQTGKQDADFGDQTVEKQKNDADVTQSQGNGNHNVSPAIALGGDASTRNHQGNHNTADASIRQSNAATQSQSAKQSQDLEQEGGGDCCKRSYDCKRSDPCEPEREWGKMDEREECCAGRSQTGEQSTSFGDQHVGEQRNDAGVIQKQGSYNRNVSPAIAFGGTREPCGSKCQDSWDRDGGNASTWNAQGSGNEASAYVRQTNSVDQSQRAYQWQSLVQSCKEVILR